MPLGYIALRLLLHVNGDDLLANQVEKLDLIMAIADGSLNDVTEIAEPITKLSTRLP